MQQAQKQLRTIDLALYLIIHTIDLALSLIDGIPSILYRAPLTYGLISRFSCPRRSQSTSSTSLGSRAHLILPIQSNIMHSNRNNNSGHYSVLLRLTQLTRLSDHITALISYLLHLVIKINLCIVSQK